MFFIADTRFSLRGSNKGRKKSMEKLQVLETLKLN